MRSSEHESQHGLLVKPSRRVRPWFALTLSAWIAVAFSSVHGAPNQTQQDPRQTTPDLRRATAAEVRAVVGQYCVACHNDKLKSGGIVLDSLDTITPSVNADVWERVIRKLHAGSMPPAGRPRPDRATYEAVTRGLEADIDRVAAAHPNPGRSSAVHRLNRTEYHNAVRDLFGLDIDVASMLPGDETSDTGFDNNADVLSMTTAQLERYMSAARHVTRLATGLLPTGPGFETFTVPVLLLQDDRQSDDLPLGSRGGIAVRYDFPADGEYLFKIGLRTNFQDYLLGLGRPQEFEIRIDGESVKRFTVGGEAKGKAAPTTFSPAELGDPEWEAYLHQADEGLEARVEVKAGPRVVGVSFLRNMWEPEGILQPRHAGEVLSNDEQFHGNAAVESVAIGGPYRIGGAGDTPSRRRIFICRPTSSTTENACATRILSQFARRAYRRPSTDHEVQVLLEFFKTGRDEGGSFDAGIQFALERLLVDPNFLLRVEREPASATPGEPYRLTDVDVASRLSFFLWSSIPDEPLLELAERRRLTDVTVLNQQVRRMLADTRAKALVDNFVSQWLHLRNLADVAGEPAAFPNFDANLVDAFRQETELFVTSTLREDASVLDLLGADYTFVNERLARHYGIPGVYGNRFRRVTLPNLERRGGLLGHGGLLALTSYPDRTSPVLRGKWLLDTILGAPPASPPPNVPALPERGEGGKTVSVRQRLEQHRKNPACASCHANIDPPGFALENFDGLGAWRTVDEGGLPINAAGTMPNGATIDGFVGLRSMLLSQPDRFAGTVVEKLLAYALGRRLEYYDQPTVRTIVREAARDHYRWSSLMIGIVKSPPFLMRNRLVTN